MIYTDRFAVSGPKLENFSFPKEDALFVVGDTHGQAETLKELLIGLARFVTPGKKRTLVFLGDFIDRGPDSIGCLDLALNQAKDLAAVDEVVFLPGNHELLMLDAFEISVPVENSVPRDINGAAGCWFVNGGSSFLNEAYEKTGQEMPGGTLDAVKGLAEMLPHPGFDSFTEMVRSWPNHFRMGDVVCTHAGIKPKKPHEFTFSLTQEEHYGLTPGNQGNHTRHWAWIRDEFLAWNAGWPETGEKDDENGCLIIHGHTVPKDLKTTEMESGEDVKNIFCRMETNARICVDGGSARAKGVAATIITCDGVRIAFEPVYKNEM